MFSERRPARERSVCTGKTEARTTPSSVGESGSDRRKAVWRSAGHSFRGAVGTVAVAFTSRESTGSVLGRWHGCSCRTSVAEAGEKHLPRSTEVSARGQRRAQVARRGGKPMTGRVERVGRKGAGYSSAWTFTGKHENAHSAARSRVESAEGALVSCAVVSLTGGSRAGAWQSGNGALPDERRARRANAGTEPRRERPRSDRERQRLRRRVRPPQSKGAGGLQPTTAERCEERHGRSSRGTQSSCAR